MGVAAAATLSRAMRALGRQERVLAEAVAVVGLGLTLSAMAALVALVPMEWSALQHSSEVQTKLMNTTQRLIITVPIAAVLAASAAPPVGPWITYDILSQETNWAVTAVLPQFDPSTLVGTEQLFAVEFIVAASADSAFSYQNTSFVPADVTLELAASVTFSGSLPDPVVGLFNATSSTVAPGNSISDALHDDDTLAGSLGGPDLLPFIGLGTVDIPVTALGGSRVEESVGNGIYSIDTTAGASVSIRYLVRDERGGGEVPEGMNWPAAAVLVGAFCFGAHLRRWVSEKA